MRAAAPRRVPPAPASSAARGGGSAPSSAPSLVHRPRQPGGRGRRPRHGRHHATQDRLVRGAVRLGCEHDHRPVQRPEPEHWPHPRVDHTGARTDCRGPDIRMLEWAVPDGAPTSPTCAPSRKPTPPHGSPSKRYANRPHRCRRSRSPATTPTNGSPEGAWIPPGAWQECVGQPDLIPGEDVWIGVDVGGERSASAVAWINSNLHVGIAIYHGDQGVLDCVDQVRELAATFNVREVLFDPWRFTQGAQELEREGITVTTFAQSDARMIPASDRLYRAIIERRLTLPDNPQLRAHAHAIARHSRRGWRIDKSQRSDNIDSIIALCMALEAAENQPPPSNSSDGSSPTLPRLRPTHPRRQLLLSLLATPPQHHVRLGMGRPTRRSTTTRPRVHRMRPTRRTRSPPPRPDPRRRHQRPRQPRAPMQALPPRHSMRQRSSVRMPHDRGRTSAVPPRNFPDNPPLDPEQRRASIRWMAPVLRSYLTEDNLIREFDALVRKARLDEPWPPD